MGVFVIACYRPKPGKEGELEALTHEHAPILRKLGLVTDRPAYAMRSKDGSIVEVFEWRSKEAIDSAHSHPAVLKLWERYGAVCDYAQVNSLAEAADLFAMFEPIF
jgi:hypothetical protein